MHSHKLVSGLCLVLAIALTSCVALHRDGATAQPIEFRRLSSDEIRTAVDGREVILMGAYSPGSNRISETYCAGRSVLSGTRAPLYGTYTIETDRLCVTREGQAEPECALFFQDHAGRVYRQSTEAPESRPQVVEIIGAVC